jgi:methylisocitrate lyase
MNSQSPGARYRELAKSEAPLQTIGVINAYVALMAQQTGAKAVYLSGAGVANSSYALPDLGVTTLDNVLEDAKRITGAVELPLLVDIDTGFGAALMIARTIKEMERAGVAAVHMEDQVAAKRCGHRPGKETVSTGEMVDRIRAAVDARTDPNFVIMARTDAVATEGLEPAIERAVAYRDAGADMIFAEAVTELEDYRSFKKAVGVPILANITEFGKTPLFTKDELGSVGVDIVLYPLSANRAMNKAALTVMQSILQDGTQSGVLDRMQTRKELYDFLGYEEIERKLDKMFQEGRNG